MRFQMVYSTRQSTNRAAQDGSLHRSRSTTFLRPVFLAGLLLLSACSARNQTQPEPDTEAGTPLGVITLVPSSPPKHLFTDNRSIPVLGIVANGIANTIWDKYKSADFNNQYADYRETAGEKMTAAIRRELQKRGFTVKQATPEHIVRDEHGQLDFSRFPPGTSILDIRLDNFGMYSGRTSSNYVPYIDAYIVLATPKYEEEGHLHYAYYMYGGTANREGWGYLLPDPKYAFPDFRSLMEQSDLVRESYDHGIARIARQLVKDIRYEFKPAAQMPRHDQVTTTAANRIARTRNSLPIEKPKTATSKRNTKLP